MKSSTFEGVSEALFLWLKQQRETDVPLSVSIPHEKGKFLASNFMGKMYKLLRVLDGWIVGKNYGVRQLFIAGENCRQIQALSSNFEDNFFNKV